MKINRNKLIDLLLTSKEEEVDLTDVPRQLQIRSNVELMLQFIESVVSRSPLISPKIMSGYSLESRSDLLPCISLGRRAGHTTASCEYISKNIDAYLIVPNTTMKEDIKYLYPDIKDRIVTESFLGKGLRLEGKVLILDLPLKYYKDKGSYILALMSSNTVIIVGA